MRALEKIGAPAVAEIERALPALTSSDHDDIRWINDAIYMLSTIGGDAVPPILIRLGMTASDERVRYTAFASVLSGRFNYDDQRAGRPWEDCVRISDLQACPLDIDTQRFAAAVRPLLGSIRDRLSQEPSEGVRVTAAKILVLLGEGTTKATGEQILNGASERYRASLAHSSLESQLHLGDSRYVQPVMDMITRPTGIPKYLTAEGHERQWAIPFAARSHNLAFVPALIDVLGSTDFNGMTSSTMKGGVVTETRFTFAQDALAALRQLTLQDLGADPQPWQDWWAANRNTDWKTVLTRSVAARLPRLPGIATEDVWIVNDWMNDFAEADDPAVLPLVAAYLRRPNLNAYMTGPGRFGGPSPAVLRLLLNLTSQGSGEARALLVECSDGSSYPLAIDCARVVALLDRQRGLDRLNALLSPPQGWGWQVAHTLVGLGDARAIPALIGFIAANGPEHSLAYADLRRYTQEDLPDSAAAWQQWWRDAERTFTVKTTAARIDNMNFGGGG